MVSSVRSSLLLQECKHTTALPLSHLRAATVNQRKDSSSG
jgi:hypothetical protein